MSLKKSRMSVSKSDGMRATLSAIEDKSSVFYKGRARLSEIADIRPMSAGGTWKNRLQEAIRSSGKSQRDISLKAGMGPGYVNSLFKESKDPTVENLHKPLACILNSG